MRELGLRKVKPCVQGNIQANFVIVKYRLYKNVVRLGNKRENDVDCLTFV